MQSGSAKSICQKNGEILKSAQIVHVVFLHLLVSKQQKKFHSYQFGVKTRKQYEKAIKMAVLIA